MNDATDTARKINAIRRAAGNPMVNCCICGGAADAPRRRSRDGRVVEGCVGSFHVDYADSWWLRPVAAKMRAHELADMEAL